MTMISSHFQIGSILPSFVYYIIILTLCMLGIVFIGFLSSADTFQHYFFQNILSGNTAECQTAWNCRA